MQRPGAFSARRQRGPALLLLLALFAGACGSTAYRDRVEAQAAGVDGDVALPAFPSGDHSTSPATPEPVAVGTDAPTPGATGTEGPSATAAPTTAPGATPAPGQPSAAPSPTAQPSPGAPTTQPTTPPTTTGLPQAAENGRGATDDTVRVGVISLTSFQNMGANLGFSVADKGDVAGQIQTLADWINANGGIAGRDLVPIQRIYTQEEASPGAEAQMCNAFADDDDVWGVMLYGQIHESTRYCYSSKGILMLDPTPFVYDETLYTENAPYLWSVAFPNYTKVMRTLPHALAETDYFDPLPSRDEIDVAVGVLHWDTPSAKRVLQRDLGPALDAVGHPIASSYGVDGSSVATIQNGLSNAITAFRQAGVNRVFFIGGSPLAPFFYSTAESDGFRPRYAVTSLDQPRHTASDRGTPPQMVDAVGIGFNVDVDVEDEDMPVGAIPNEELCLDVLAAGGHTFERRENSNYALAVCSTFMLLKQGAETITGGLTAPVWSAHAEQIGTSFHPSLWFDAEFGPGNHDGTETYLPMRHFTDCDTTSGGCFHYTSSDRQRFR